MANNTLDVMINDVIQKGSKNLPEPLEGERLSQQISDEAIIRRKQMVVRAATKSVEWNPQGANPKNAFRVILCRLLENPQDQMALDYIPIGLGFRSKGDTFGKSNLARIFAQFGDQLPQDIQDQIFREVTTYDGFLTGGTENHIAMRRTAGFLFGERFPDATFHHGLTGKELAEECLQYMIKYGQTLYRNSMVEFLSPIYLGVHIATWLNIAEYAKDPRAKICGKAILDYMLTDLAINSHCGIIIPPATRAKGLVKEDQMLSTLRPNTQWTGWLYWDAGNGPQTQEELENAPDWKGGPLMLHCLSDYLPDPVIRNIGAKRIATPYSLIQSRANREVISLSHINKYGMPNPVDRNPPNSQYVTRSVYVNRDYAIGAGTRLEDIHESTLRHAHSFSITWRDKSPYNWLFFVHPYWYTNREQNGKPLREEDWSGTSPFFQMVHWENAAVLLFDIPENDPYENDAENANPKWLSNRPEKLYHRIHAYIPDTIDETITTDHGVYLRAKEVYVGIHPIGGKAYWEDSDHKGYRRIVIEGNLVGAAVEVGDRAEYESFSSFQEKVSATKLNADDLQTQKRVRYSSTRGHHLDLQHNPKGGRPIASVNDAILNFDQWPTCESPYLTCRDGVMDVNDGHSGFRVNWQNELPQYSSYKIQ